MWTQIIIVTALVATCLTDKVPKKGKSSKKDDKIIVDFKDLLSDEEKFINNKFKLKKGVPARLSQQDFSCYVYSNSLCSEKMLKIKSVMIQTIMDDCTKCSEKDKKRAGKVAVSIMNQDPMAWKLLISSLKDEKGSSA